MDKEININKTVRGYGRNVTIDRHVIGLLIFIAVIMIVMTNMSDSFLTFRNLFNKEVIFFLVLITGFTLNHMQFYETLPNFVSD